MAKRPTTGTISMPAALVISTLSEEVGVPEASVTAAVAGPSQCPGMCQ